MTVRVPVDGEISEVEIGDLNSRPIQAVVAGELFAVWPEDVAGVVTTASPAAELGAAGMAPPRATVAPAAENGEEIVAAPLPGDIVVVAVRPGETVTVGQLLCTVESMKMNNPVRSPRSRCRWRAKQRKTAGAVRTIPPAMSSPQ